MCFFAIYLLKYAHGFLEVLAFEYVDSIGMRIEGD